MIDSERSKAPEKSDGFIKMMMNTAKPYPVGSKTFVRSCHSTFATQNVSKPQHQQLLFCQARNTEAGFLGTWNQELNTEFHLKSYISNQTLTERDSAIISSSASSKKIRSRSQLPPKSLPYAIRHCYSYRFKTQTLQDSRWMAMVDDQGLRVQPCNHSSVEEEGFSTESRRLTVTAQSPLARNTHALRKQEEHGEVKKWKGVIQCV